MTQTPRPTPGYDIEAENKEVRERAARGTLVGARIEGLTKAVEAARGRVDPALLAEIEATAERAAGRLRLSASHTVVAIAGATGSGKSSTFNALTGLELSSTGVRRPTTSWATACVWGKEGAVEILDWLGIPPRHQTMRESMLDTRADDEALDGVVLMDLPDHDSTELSHHLEVDRLVELADLLVWVLDPQKYADAAIHDRYFAPFTAHQDVMLVVLNHIDTIAEDRRQAMVDDVRRLLAADGLPDVKVLAISARAGIGMDELRAELRSRVDAKRSATRRAEADLATAANRLDAAAGGTAPRDVSVERVTQLTDAVAEAAGISATTELLAGQVRQRAVRATNWPPLALLSGSAKRSDIRSTTVPRHVVQAEARRLVDDACEGMPGGWSAAVHRTVADRQSAAADRLESELAKATPAAGRMPGTINAIRVVQWLLILVVLAAGAWWLISALDLADLPDPWGDPAMLGPVPLPAAVLAGAVVLGWVLALVGRSLATKLADERVGDADRRLRGVVADVLETEVVAPVRGELMAYDEFRKGIATALQ